MKKLGLALIAVTMLFIASCSEDGTPTPDTDPREKFLGTWNCKETIGASNTTFQIDISKDASDADYIFIENFSGYGDSAIAHVEVLDNSIVIPAQNIGVGSTIPVQGTGVYNNDKINMTYTTDGNSATAVCTH